jgi:hypothetical protein
MPLRPAKTLPICALVLARRLDDAAQAVALMTAVTPPDCA